MARFSSVGTRTTAQEACRRSRPQQAPFQGVKQGSHRQNVSAQLRHGSGTSAVRSTLRRRGAFYFISEPVVIAASDRYVVFGQVSDGSYVYNEWINGQGWLGSHG